MQITQNATAGTNVMNFIDAYLDAIYKLYGRNNTINATFTVTTDRKYEHSKSCIITLKGNQKTVHRNINGTWKRGKLWIKVNGAWRKAVIWRNINGTWKRGI